MTRSGKFVTEHAFCFSEIGRIDIEVLMTHWQGKKYHLLEILPIKRGCFLKALVGTQQRPDTEMAVEVELEGSSTCSKEAVFKYPRNQIQQLTDNMVNWQSYASVYHQLSRRTRADQPYCLYRGPLIFYWIVEHHNPDRCMRQFGR